MITNVLNTNGAGGNGGMLPEVGSRHFRRNCRDIVQILQFQRNDGTAIFSDDEITDLLRAAYPLAMRAAQEGKEREYRAAVWVIMEAAKLEQRDRPERHEHAHLHAEVDIDTAIEALEREVRSRGLLGDE